MKKIILLLLILMTSSCAVAKEMIGEKIEQVITDTGSENTPEKEDIVIYRVDDSWYTFTYQGEQFSVRYDPDNWCIYDSYKITDTDDIYRIVEQLSEIHPIPSKDRTSYRSVQDMADEWILHNLAYRILKDDPEYRERARNVDLDPDDEGLSLNEFLHR